LSQVLMMRLGPSLERVLERRVPGGPVMLALDVNLVLIASACGLAVTMLCAAAPLLATWRASLATSLARGGRAAADSRGAHRWRALLIGAEVAASLTLLVGAVLMIQTSFVLLRVDFGIRADAVTTASLALPPRTYPDPGSRAAFFARLEHELAGVPGVTSFALGDWWPLQGSQPRRVRAGDERAGSEAAANVFGVSSTYFATLRMTLRDGRVFETADRQGGEPVAIVSASLARRLWPATRAVGQTVRIDGSDETPLVSARVVGVVNDVRQSHTDVEQLDLYLPHAQRATRFAFIYVTGPPLQSVERDLRLALARLDANVALGAPRGLQEGIDSERARPMFIASLLAVFAVLAAMLALVGMHGVIAYAVRQRRREVAVRLAIGARPHMVTALFVRQGVIVLASGIAAGLVGALALGRGLQSQLHGVRAAEPHTLVLTATAFALCGLAAIWWPAWRAAATDPALVLKED
jgi:predicted permease